MVINSSCRQSDHGTRDVPLSEMSDEDIVISGISGKFPESLHMDEFYDNLINHVDMVVDDDRRDAHFGPQKLVKYGKIKDVQLGEFDNMFFSVSSATADVMLTECRLGLEMTYEAIVDAGESMESMSENGRRTAVFAGYIQSDSRIARHRDLNAYSSASAMCAHNFYVANKISNAFNFRGPSKSVDTACSGVLVCIEEAARMIRSGAMDSAVIFAFALVLGPYHFLDDWVVNAVSPDGVSRSFDAKCNGIARSEGGGVILLQRRRDCKRCYARVIHTVQNNDGKSDTGFHRPSGLSHYQMMRQLYNEASIDTRQVTYVECHGTGTQAGDHQETIGITHNGILTSGKDGPLLIGSVKSNCGHPEYPSGIHAIAKVVLSIQRGIIPANLHFETPNPKIHGLFDGSLKVVTENTPYDGKLIAINNFGLGGTNGHMVLGPPDTRNKPFSPAGKDLRLFTYGGRTEESARHMLQFAKKHSTCLEVQALLSKSANQDNFMTPFRGYTILNGRQEKEECQAVLTSRPPVWFVFTGMGCQWPNMGKDMLKISVFKETLERLDKFTKDKFDLDLMAFFTEESSETSLDQTRPTVVITAIQIALVNILRSVGIEPDGMFGHSNGEVACGYADGCLTEEETITVAYARSMMQSEGKAILPEGKMAAVGLTWEECLRRCPEGAIPACHNSHDNVTVSGEAAAVTKLINELTAEGIFVREVKSGGMAYHTPMLLGTKKKRSPRWISTAFKEEDWGTPLAQYCSMEYYLTNNVSPVYFHEAVQRIPKGAVVIEIGPHALLMSIVKRTLDNDLIPVSLMRRNHEDNSGFCLSNLGQCFINGVDIDPLKLLPPVEFPVPLETPMLSPALYNFWDHSVAWSYPKFSEFQRTGDTEDYVISTAEGAEYEYLKDNKESGTPTMPAAGLVLLAWKTLAKKLGRDISSLPVKFEGIKFLKSVTLSDDKPVTLSVSVSTITGHFEVTESGTLIAEGQLKVLPDEDGNISPMSSVDDPMNVDLGESSLSRAEFYTMWHLLGFGQAGKFRGVCRASHDFTSFVIDWSGNWLLLIDSVFHTLISSQKPSVPCVVRTVESLVIDPRRHPQIEDDEVSYLKAEIKPHKDSVICGGITLQMITSSQLPPVIPVEGIIDECIFAPYIENSPSATFKPLGQYASDCLNYIGEQLKGLSAKVKQMPYDENILKDITSSISSKNASSSTMKFQESYKDKENCGLAQTLTEMFQSLRDKGNVGEIMAASSSRLAQDKLLASLNTSYTMKSCVDIVLDNIDNWYLSFLEVNGSESRLFSYLMPHLRKEPRLEWRYTVADKVPMKKEETGNENIETISWDISSTSASAPGQHTVVLLKNVLHNQSDIQAALNKASSLLAPGGFIIVQEMTQNFPLAYILEHPKKLNTPSSTNHRKYEMFYGEEEWEKLFAQCKLDLVYKRSDGVLSTLYMLRKHVDVSQAPPYVIDVDDLDYDWVEDLKYTLADVDQLPPESKIWLVASKYDNGVIGVVKCLKDEGFGSRIRCSLINNHKPGSKSPDISEGSDEFEELRAKDLVMNIYRDGQWGTTALVQVQYDPIMAPSNDAALQQSVWGDKSTLKWVDNVRPADKNKTTIMTVCYAGLNLNDVNVLTAKQSPTHVGMTDNILGTDAAGFLQDGRRIMVPVKSSCRTHLDTEGGIVVDVPAKWTLQEAATVPFAYCTAYYALHVLTRVRRGENVLVHDATAPRGQAVIRVAHNAGCNIFATVTSEKKKQHLIKLFPQVPKSHIACLTDNEDVGGFLTITDGQGMDVIFSTSNSKDVPGGTCLLAIHGLFLQTGEDGTLDSVDINSKLRPGASFRDVDMVHVLNDKDAENIRTEIVDLMKQGIKSGTVKPLESTVFPSEEYEKAIQHLEGEDATGSTLLKISEEKTKVPSILAVAKAKCRPDHSYVIMGGLGGFGLELAHWLVTRGCHYLVISSRRGLTTGYQKYKIDMLRNMGTKVVVSTHNAITEDGARELLKEAACMAPIGGIFNLSLVLKPSTMKKQTVEKYHAVCDSKVLGTMNFDKLSRDEYKDSLHWFVTFSSQLCGRGGKGMTNYGFANSVMERICEKRQADGLPGLCIQWGWIGDVGFVTSSMTDTEAEESTLAFYRPQSIHSCLDALDKALLRNHPVVGSYLKGGQRKVSGAVTEDSEGSLLQTVCKILGLKNVDTLNEALTMADVGIDSMMTGEVQKVLEKSTKVVLSSGDIRKLSFKDIKRMGGQTKVAGAIKKESKGSLLEAVGKILGLKNVDTMNEKLIMADVGIDSMMTGEVQKVLEKSAKVVLSGGDIRKLSFKDIKGMDPANK